MIGPNESNSHVPFTFVSRIAPSLALQIRFERKNDVTIRKTSNAIRRGLALALLSALLVGAITPVAAGAQATSPTCDQYSSTNCQQINNNGGGGGVDDGSGDGLNSRIGSLPFTGFDVLSMALVALAVTGLGLVLQRAVSRPREEL